MIKMLCRTVSAFFLLSMLLACSTPLQPSGKLGKLSRDDFMSGLRWKRYQVAASLMLPEHRQEFMNTFSRLKDIHIVDVRLVNMQGYDENRRFDTTMEMDYYLLPSVTIKTFSFDQSWELRDNVEQAPAGYFIVTPFPPFP